MSYRFSLLLLFGVALTPASAAERLNIISIVTDDQARWGLGCYGNDEVRTPNMDRLAREGAGSSMPSPPRRSARRAGPAS